MSDIIRTCRKEISYKNLTFEALKARRKEERTIHNYVMMAWRRVIFYNSLKQMIQACFIQSPLECLNQTLAHSLLICLNGYMSQIIMSQIYKMPQYLQAKFSEAATKTYMGCNLCHEFILQVQNQYQHLQPNELDKETSRYLQVLQQKQMDLSQFQPSNRDAVTEQALAYLNSKLEEIICEKQNSRDAKNVYLLLIYLVFLVKGAKLLNMCHSVMELDKDLEQYNTMSVQELQQQMILIWQKSV